MWRKVCGETTLSRSVGHSCAAMRAYLSMSSATASLLRLRPRLVGEERVARLSLTFLHPDARRPGGLGSQRGAALFSSLAGALEVSSGPEANVLAAEAGELGDPQPGLYGDCHQGVVAPTGPAVAVGGGEEGFALGVGEERNVAAVAAFGWYGQHAGDEGGVLGVAEHGEAEQ